MVGLTHRLEQLLGEQTFKLARGFVQRLAPVLLEALLPQPIQALNVIGQQAVLNRVEMFHALPPLTLFKGVK
ncbi:hypothetical protein MBH78_22480 [Oceanimonas sp. NS1]|nr:hypothetical protein [Oceanimonas sp. NS1]